MGLSRREREILEGLIAGKTSRVMAYELELSPVTVDDRVTRMLEKFGYGSRVELAAHAKELLAEYPVET